LKDDRAGIEDNDQAPALCDKDEHMEVHLSVNSGVITKAKGSSYVEKNGVKVICAVYGPRESQRKTEFSTQGKLICDVSFAPFSQKAKHLQESRTKSISNLLETALQCAVCLESFPKSQVEVYIKVLQDSGCTLAPAIICASLALADAGIETYDLVSACSLVFDDDHIALDPGVEEISQSTKRGIVTIGYLPSLNRISCIVQDGVTASDRSIACINQCINGCIRTHTVMKDCLVAGAKRKEELAKHQSKLE